MSGLLELCRTLDLPRSVKGLEGRARLQAKGRASEAQLLRRRSFHGLYGLGAPLPPTPRPKKKSLPSLLFSSSSKLDTDVETNQQSTSTLQPPPVVPNWRLPKTPPPQPPIAPSPPPDPEPPPPPKAGRSKLSSQSLRETTRPRLIEKRFRRRTLATIEEGKPLGVETVSGTTAMRVGGRRGLDPAAPRGHHTLLLRRQPGVSSLGIGLAGGADKECPPIVSCLRAGSIADRSDAVQVGDFLVGVNGIRVTDLAHEQILTLLRNAGDEVRLALEYSLAEGHFARAAGTRRRTGELLLRRAPEEGDGGFGFTLRGGAFGPDPAKARPLTVTNVRPGGAADREGRLRVGDRVLAIDGHDVTSATLFASSQLIAKARNNITLIIEYDVSVLESISRAKGPVLLEIEKPGGVELGLRLASRPIGPGRRRLFIRHIVPASIADRCGALGEGDELLSVDGVGLECATLAEAAQLLKGTDTNGLINLHVLPHHQVLNRASSVPRTGETAATDSASFRQPPVHYQPRSAKDTKGSSGMRRKLGDRERSGSSKGRRRPWSRDRGPDDTAQRPPDPALRASAPNLQAAQNNQDQWRREAEVGKRLVHRTSYPTRAKGSVSAWVSGVPCGQVCHAEVMEVVLHSWARGGFGLVLHRSPTTAVSSSTSPAPDARLPPLFISYIERGSPAERSGVLQVGDRVLGIGDWGTGGASAEEANARLRQATSPLALTVEFDVIETVLPSHGVFTVKLAKRGQNNLGVVLREAEGGGKGEPAIVAQVRTGSVAQRCGSIQPGDRILAIDNIPLATCTVDEAVRLLQRSADIVKLRIQKNGGDEDSISSTSSTVVYSVELSRKGGPLGITIASTDDSGDPVIISQLAPSGLAERTGALHVGDRILAINGESLNGKRVSEAMGLLQASADAVTLKIARCLSTGSGGFAHAHPRGYSASLQRASGTSQDDHGVKTGTPVQSIDSAVESLEDSPLDRGGSGNGGAGSGGRQTAGVSEELSVELERALRAPGSASLGSGGGAGSDHGAADSGFGSSDTHDPFCACACQPSPLSPDEIAQRNWMKVLEALETVGEEEMLAKLEESILAGAVPGPHSSHCPLSQPQVKPQPPPPPPSNGPSTSFSSTNTILRHPGMKGGVEGNSRVPSSYLSESSGSLSSGDSGLPPPKPPHPTASTFHPGPSSSFQPPSPLPPSSTPSSIQLSGTPSLDGMEAEQLLTPPHIGVPIPSDVFRVTLFKDPIHRDFGFSVSDGQSESGVFIKAVRPGGPASRSGAVRPFDRLLQVNEHWVERLGCETTVPLLLASTERVVVLLARDSSPPRTISSPLAPPSTIAEDDEDALTPSPPPPPPLQTQL